MDKIQKLLLTLVASTVDAFPASVIRKNESPWSAATYGIVKASDGLDDSTPGAASLVRNHTFALSADVDGGVKVADRLDDSTHAAGKMVRKHHFSETLAASGVSEVSSGLADSTRMKSPIVAPGTKNAKQMEINANGNVQMLAVKGDEDAQHDEMKLFARVKADSERAETREIRLGVPLEDSQQWEKKLQSQSDASRNRDTKVFVLLDQAAREREKMVQNQIERNRGRTTLWQSHVGLVQKDDLLNKQISSKSLAMGSLGIVMPRGKLTTKAFHKIDCEKSKQGASSGAMHVVVSRWGEDVNWILNSEEELRMSGIVVNICEHSGTHSLRRNQSCDVPYNRGTEGSAYLRYIITHWEDLPDVMIFTDAREHPWHWKQSLRKLDLFKCLQTSEALEQRDMKVGLYMGLNGHRAEMTTFNFCDDANLWMDNANSCTYKRDWNLLLRPYGFGECPSHVVTDGSSIFLVTRERVRSNPYELYQGLYDFTLSDGVHPDGPGYFMEWVWSIIFREGTIYEAPKVDDREKEEVRLNAEQAATKAAEDAASQAANGVGVSDTSLLPEQLRKTELQEEEAIEQLVFGDYLLQDASTGKLSQDTKLQANDGKEALRLQALEGAARDKAVNFPATSPKTNIDDVTTVSAAVVLPGYVAVSQPEDEQGEEEDIGAIQPKPEPACEEPIFDASSNMSFLCQEGPYTGFAGFVLQTLGKLKRCKSSNVHITWRGPCPFCSDADIFGAFFERRHVPSLAEHWFKQRGSTDETRSCIDETFTCHPSMGPITTEGRLEQAAALQAHFRPARRVSDQVTQFWKTKLAKFGWVLGVHVRATDYQDLGDFAFPPISHYLRAAKLLIKQAYERAFKAGQDRLSIGVFVASDNDEAVSLLQTGLAKFSSVEVITSHAYRARYSSGDNLVISGKVHKRSFGEQVLIDTLLLSQCDAMLHWESAVARLAALWRPQLASVTVLNNVEHRYWKDKILFKTSKFETARLASCFKETLTGNRLVLQYGDAKALGDLANGEDISWKFTGGTCWTGLDEESDDWHCGNESIAELLK